MGEFLIAVLEKRGSMEDGGEIFWGRIFRSHLKKLCAVEHEGFGISYCTKHCGAMQYGHPLRVP